MKKCVLKITVFAFIFVLVSCKEKQNQELNQVITEVIQEEKAVEEKVVEQEPVVQEVEQETVLEEINEEETEEIITVVQPATYTFSFEGIYYTPFKSDGLYGFIDDRLNVKIKPTYEFVSRREDGFYCMINMDSGDYYNPNLMKIQRPKVGRTNDSERYSINLLNGEITKIAINQKYMKSYFYEGEKGLIIEKEVFEKERPWTYSVGDIYGNIIARNVEQANENYSEGLMAVIFQDGKSGFIDENGSLAIKTPLYIDPEWLGPRTEPALPYRFAEGLVVVRVDVKTWNIFDKNGNSFSIPDELTPNHYLFSEGLLKVKSKSKQNKIGYMNKEMEIEIPCVFDYAEAFVNGYAIVKFNGEDAVLDKKGNVYLSKDLLEGNKEPFTNVMAR